jgi:hypothetical protein
MRFPWLCDVGALSRNNAVVQHCYVTMQQYTVITYATMGTEIHVSYDYEIVAHGLLLIWGISVGRLREKVLLKESPTGHVSFYSGR